MVAAVVAGQARVRHVAQRHRREPFDRAGLRRIADVRLAGTVARLAAMDRLGRARILRLAVQRLVDLLAFGVVAADARVLADVVARLGEGRSGWNQEREQSGEAELSCHRRCRAALQTERRVS
jgi:hypothetical protein